MKNKINWKSVIVVAGAYVSYGIGSGFATGQEVLQNFAAWGTPACFVALILCAVAYSYFCGSLYRAGLMNDFKNESDAYVYFFGKYLGRAIDIFSVVLVFLFIIAMFSGCASTIHLYYGVDPLVGQIIMAVVCGGTVALGLRKMQDILSCMGVVFIIYILIMGIMALCKADQSLTASSVNMSQYIEAGKVLPAVSFGFKSAITAGISYGLVALVVAFPFLVSLGKRVTNKSEANVSGIATGVAYTAACLIVTCIILFNLDYIMNNGGEQVPLLSAIHNMAPSISWTFAIILMLGIYTTITGYIWFVSSRFAADRTPKSCIIAGVVTFVGMIGGYFIPFNTITNILYPFTGWIGGVMVIFLIYKDIKNRKSVSTKTAE